MLQVVRQKTGCQHTCNLKKCTKNIIHLLIGVLMQVERKILQGVISGEGLASPVGIRQFLQMTPGFKWWSFPHAMTLCLASFVQREVGGVEGVSSGDRDHSCVHSTWKTQPKISRQLEPGLLSPWEHSMGLDIGKLLQLVWNKMLNPLMKICDRLKGSLRRYQTYQPFGRKQCIGRQGIWPELRCHESLPQI